MFNLLSRDLPKAVHFGGCPPTLIGPLPDEMSNQSCTCTAPRELAGGGRSPYVRGWRGCYPATGHPPSPAMAEYGSLGNEQAAAVGNNNVSGGLEGGAGGGAGWRSNFSVLMVSTTALVVLACVGVWLNVSQVVTVGPYPPEEPEDAVRGIQKLSICEASFCGGAGGGDAAFGKDAGTSDGRARASPEELASCSARLRDISDATGVIELGLTVRFENPTHLPVQLDRFNLSFGRDAPGHPVLGDCRTTQANATVSPRGLNRMRVSCSLRVADVARAAAAWWGGADVALLSTWGAVVTLAPEGQRVVTFPAGSEAGGEEPARFSVPRRPAGAGGEVRVTVNEAQLGGTGGGRAAAKVAAQAQAGAGPGGQAEAEAEAEAEAAAEAAAAEAVAMAAAAEAEAVGQAEGEAAAQVSASLAGNGEEGGSVPAAGDDGAGTESSTTLAALFGGTGGGLFPGRGGAAATAGTASAAGAYTRPMFSST